MTVKRVVILGAGTAATQAVDTLRRSAFTGSITLVGEEPELQDHMAARRLLAARAEVDLSKLANSEIPLKQCVLSAEQRCTSAHLRGDTISAGISE